VYSLVFYPSFVIRLAILKDSVSLGVYFVVKYRAMLCFLASIY